MDEWKDRKVMIHQKDKAPKEVIAPTFNGLAMWKKDDDFWTLTHAQSGRYITHIEGRQDWAFRLAAEIARLIDWNSFATGKDILAAIPDIKNQVNAIIDHHSPLSKVFETINGKVVQHG